MRLYDYEKIIDASIIMMTTMMTKDRCDFRHYRNNVVYGSLNQSAEGTAVA
jgi:hypothetical protein